MKITAIHVIVCSPGRNFVTVRVETDEGLTGTGDATLNGRELAVATYLSEHLEPCLIGRDPMRSEDIWQYLYRGAYWRRGPVTMAAISGIDAALWDIKAKAAGMPLYQLLGGASRDGVLCYTHASGDEIPQAVEAVQAKLEQGFEAVRVQCGLPGIPNVYGTGDQSSTNSAEWASLPKEELWDTSVYLRHAPRLFAAVRKAVGEVPHLLHDAHHRLTSIEAARLGRDLEPHRLFWLEDAVAAEMPEKFRLIRQHTTTPLALGEVFNTIHDARLLIEERLIDYIRATCVHAGGITALRRIADLAALHDVRTGFHGAEDMSPLCLAANLHLGLSIPNLGIQEYAGYSDLIHEVFPCAWSRDGARLHPGDAAGHGGDVNEALAAKYPYERAYLPVARLRDGTLWHW